MLLTEAIPLVLSKYKRTETLPCKSAGVFWNSGQSNPHLLSVTDYMNHVA